MVKYFILSSLILGVAHSSIPLDISLEDAAFLQRLAVEYNEEKKRDAAEENRAARIAFCRSNLDPSIHRPKPRRPIPLRPGETPQKKPNKTAQKTKMNANVPIFVEGKQIYFVPFVSTSFTYFHYTPFLSSSFEEKLLLFYRSNRE